MYSLSFQHHGKCARHDYTGTTRLRLTVFWQILSSFGPTKNRDGSSKIDSAPTFAPFPSPGSARTSGPSGSKCNRRNLQFIQSPKRDSDIQNPSLGTKEHTMVASQQSTICSSARESLSTKTLLYRRYTSKESTDLVSHWVTALKCSSLFFLHHLNTQTRRGDAIFSLRFLFNRRDGLFFTEIFLACSKQQKWITHPLHAFELVVRRLLDAVGMVLEGGVTAGVVLLLLDNDEKWK